MILVGWECAALLCSDANGRKSGTETGHSLSRPGVVLCRGGAECALDFDGRRGRAKHPDHLDRGTRLLLYSIGGERDGVVLAPNGISTEAAPKYSTLAKKGRLLIQYIQAAMNPVKSPNAACVHT